MTTSGLILTAIISSRYVLAERIPGSNPTKSIWDQMSSSDANLYQKILDDVKRQVNEEFADEDPSKDITFGPNGEVLSISGEVPGLAEDDSGYTLTFAPATEYTQSSTQNPVAQAKVQSTDLLSNNTKVGGSINSTPDSIISQPTQVQQTPIADAETPVVAQSEPQPSPAPYIPPAPKASPVIFHSTPTYQVKKEPTQVTTPKSEPKTEVHQESHPQPPTQSHSEPHSEPHPGGSKHKS